MILFESKMPIDINVGAVALWVYGLFSRKKPEPDYTVEVGYVFKDKENKTLQLTLKENTPKAISTTAGSAPKVISATARTVSNY